jgi:molecular chaperone GrpE
LYAFLLIKSSTHHKKRGKALIFDRKTFTYIHIQKKENNMTKQKQKSPAPDTVDDTKTTDTPTDETKSTETTPTIEQLTEEVARWKDAAARAMAEMENLRKRTRIDIEKATRYANASFAKELLPVADCLERATDCARQELAQEKAAGKTDCKAVENLLTGVDMTYKQLLDALKKQDIERMACLDTVFDPNLHKVIQEVDMPDKPTGTIVQILQPGYTIGGDRVLREAMVIVSK